MMRYSTMAVVLVAASLLGACEETCTEELAQSKGEALLAKITEIATKDPSKLVALQPKMEEIQAQMEDAGNDPSKACAAIDAVMAELEK